MIISERTGKAADRSDDKVRYEEGEMIVDEDGDDGLGDAVRLDGIPISVNRKTAARTETRAIFAPLKPPG